MQDGQCELNPRLKQCCEWEMFQSHSSLYFSSERQKIILQLVQPKRKKGTLYHCCWVWKENMWYGPNRNGLHSYWVLWRKCAQKSCCYLQQKAWQQKCRVEGNSLYYVFQIILLDAKFSGWTHSKTAYISNQKQILFYLVVAALTDLLEYEKPEFGKTFVFCFDAIQQSVCRRYKRK